MVSEAEAGPFTEAVKGFKWIDEDEEDTAF